MPLPLQALAEQQHASDMQQERELRRQGDYMAAAAAEAVIRDCADRRQSLDQVTAALPTVLKHWGGVACLNGVCQHHAVLIQWVAMPGQRLLAIPLMS